MKAIPRGATPIRPTITKACSLYSFINAHDETFVCVDDSGALALFFRDARAGGGSPGAFTPLSTGRRIAPPVVKAAQRQGMAYLSVKKRVTITSSEQQRRRDGKVIRLTPAGRRHLKECAVCSTLSGSLSGKVRHAA